MLQVVEDSFNFLLVSVANLHAGQKLGNQLSQAFCYGMLTSLRSVQMKTLSTSYLLEPISQGVVAAGHSARVSLAACH